MTILPDPLRNLPLLALASWALVACSRKDDAPIPPRSLPADYEILAEGRALYHQRGCAACHGISGKGDGDRTAQLKVKPRDFRDLAAYRQGSDLASISETIRVGVTNGMNPDRYERRWLVFKKRVGDSGMAGYPFLSPEERDQIARYVIHMRTNYR